MQDDCKSCDDDKVKVRDEGDGTKTVVMPLKNGTQKFLKLGPDFRRDDCKSCDDDKVKVRDDDDR